MTWSYYQLQERSSSVLKFEPVMEGGAHRAVEHPYIDPTRGKLSEMLMVWHHTDEELAAQLVGGVYTLDVQQLHDLQSWCACSRARTRRAFRACCSAALSAALFPALLCRH